MTDIAVDVRDLSKCFRTYRRPFDRVLDHLMHGGEKRYTEKWALRDVTFDLPRGAALGLVGANGAGKSTLLTLITGISQPTTGTIQVNGRISSLLQLGAGFHPHFSGRDNVFMNAAVMGIPTREVRDRFDEIADFAELGSYMDEPLRTYSSGMNMRLGFAVALLGDPEILILDEVLAVGDMGFQQKCMDRINEIRRSGTTVLFVSHAISQVRNICDRALWIHDGRSIMAGDPTKVTDEYSNYRYARPSGRAARLEATGHAVVASIAHLADMKVCRAGSAEPASSFRSGEVADFYLGFSNPTLKGKYHLGVIVNRADEVQVFATRSLEHGMTFEGNGGYAVMRVPLEVSAGEFYVSGFLLNESCDHILDQRQAWSRFRVDEDEAAPRDQGVVKLPTRWITPGEAC